MATNLQLLNEALLEADNQLRIRYELLGIKRPFMEWRKSAEDDSAYKRYSTDIGLIEYKKYAIWQARQLGLSKERIIRLRKECMREVMKDRKRSPINRHL
jgi:hypothetical protein